VLTSVFLAAYIHKIPYPRIPRATRAYIYTRHYEMSLKIDAIPILAGSSNYPEWEQQIKRFLQSEDLYSHIEGEENNPNAPWPASYPPILPDNPTTARRTEFRN